jgi:hypothetical protein
MPAATLNVDSPSLEFVAAQCPNCAGHLQVPKDRDALKCMYCGSAIVRQSTPPAPNTGNVANLLQLAQHAQSSGNHEEAAGYYANVLEVDPRHAEAWLGKGISAGWLSTLAYVRLTEMCAAIAKAVELTSEDTRPQIVESAADQASIVAHSIWRLSWKHTCDFASVEGTWAEHLGISAQALEVLWLAHSWTPESEQPLKAIEEICSYDLKGVSYELAEGSIFCGISKPSAARAAELETMRERAIEKLKLLCPDYVSPSAEPQVNPVAIVGFMLGSIFLFLILLFWICS